MVTALLRSGNSIAKMLGVMVIFILTSEMATSNKIKSLKVEYTLELRVSCRAWIETFLSPGASSTSGAFRLVHEEDHKKKANSTEDFIYVFAHVARY